MTINEFLFKKNILMLYTSNIEIKLGFIIGLLIFIFCKEYYDQILKKRDKSIFSYKYRITNFKLNNIYCFIYITFFILFFIYIRYCYLTVHIDLKVRFKNLIYICTGIDIWNTLLILILLLLLLYVFIIYFWQKIYQFFVKELISRALLYIAIADGRCYQTGSARRARSYWRESAQHPAGP